MISGTRVGSSTWVRRLVARACARALVAFIVPGAEIARARGLDLAAAGLAVAATPRHANVLVLIGDIPAGLAPAVAVAFAQMPRPRAVLAVGSRPDAALPAPDVSASFTRGDFILAVAELRRRFAAGAWVEDGSPPFAHPAPAPTDDDASASSHTNHAMSSPHGDHAGASDAHGEHAESASHEDDMSATAQPTMQMHNHGDAGQAMHGEMAHSDHAMHGEHGAMDMSMDMDMDMSGGFMSMIAVTKDVPRSRDGLPMEWLDVPFGPLFSGLPGGLALTFTLDGDAVANAHLAPHTMMRGLAQSLMGPVERFPERLAGLDPLTPAAYRLLAWRAVEAMRGETPAEAVQRGGVATLERERASSHLNWLASFAGLLGMDALAREAARLHHALWHAQTVADVARVAKRVQSLARGYERTPLVAMRLRGVGVRPAGAAARGPILRAGGTAADARTDDPVYRTLGFAPLTCEGDDAFARLHIRLREIAQSLALVRAAGFPPAPASAFAAGTGDGTATATVETPRGAATLHLTVANGMVTIAHLDGPSAVHVGLVAPLTAQHELSDALLAVASLDLSPWEVDQ